MRESRAKALRASRGTEQAIITNIPSAPSLPHLSHLPRAHDPQGQSHRIRVGTKQKHSIRGTGFIRNAGSGSDLGLNLTLGSGERMVDSSKFL